MDKIREIAKPRPKEANENEKKLLENQNAILANSLLWLVNKKFDGIIPAGIPVGHDFTISEIQKILQYIGKGKEEEWLEIFRKFFSQFINQWAKFARIKTK